MPDYVIVSYESAAGIKFGSREDELRKLIGEPRNRRKNFVKEEVLYYEDVIVTLSKEQRSVTEVGFADTNKVWVSGVDVFNDADAFQKLLLMDDTAMESLGCVVFLQLGIALTGLQGGGNDRAITAFNKGKWDALTPRMKRVVG